MISQASLFGNPQERKVIRFKYIAETFKGRLPKSNSSKDDLSVPYLSMEYLRSNEPAIDFVDPTGLVMSSETDVILLWDGSNAGEFLRGKYGAISSTTALVKPISIDCKFLFWISKSIEPILRMFTNGMGIPHVDNEFLKNIKLLLPELPQQKQIADYLDRETTQIDNLIAAKEQMLTLLEEKRAALINHIFTRGLDTNTDHLKPSGIAWLGKIPKSWEVRRGKYLFSQSSLPVRETDEIVTCFRDGQVTLRKNRREDGFTNAVLELGYQGIRKGQLILHSMDAFAGSIGISDSDGKCSPEYIICDPLFDGIDSQYYALLLRVMALRGFIQAACTAVRERAPRIRFSHLANMFLPLPPISEQQAIVQTIEQEKDSTKDIVIALTDSIAILKERRSALITAAVTGQIALEGNYDYNQP